MARRKTTQPTEVEAFQHTGATRVNIPTQEQRDFVQTDEDSPQTMLYPRDPSLDPQLVWKGKDEQDRSDLEVDVVPIYIQEKIHPRAIIEDLRRQSAKPETAQLDLFADFNGLDDFEKQIEFYQHQQHWSNRMILGDSMLVMSSLAEKEGLKGKVQTIYIDPPYGIKFGSNWQVSTRKRDVKDGSATDATRQPEQVKAFRDTWKLGIHSYLAYLRDRFVVARDLLTESGSIFVQIGDENVHLVRSLLDEVFGPENFAGLITFTKTGGQADHVLASVADYVLWYAMDLKSLKVRKLLLGKEVGGEGASKYSSAEMPDGSRVPLSQAIGNDGTLLPGARPFRIDNLTSPRPPGEGDLRKFEYGGRIYSPGNGTFKSDISGMKRLAIAGRIHVSRSSLGYVRFIDDFPAFQLTNVWTDIGGIQSRADPKVYVVQTATKAIERCLLMTTDPGDLVLDPTCGSGTTAYVAEQWGRRWITIDTSRVALALARTRLMAARYPYYLLADSREGQQQEAEITGVPPTGEPTSGDIRKGFVYKRVPHITLKSIANNPDIREGMTREEIDQAIMRHADTETLYDQPYEDKKRVRVSGPFTVESLSPHRVRSTDEPEQHDNGLTVDEMGRQDDYAEQILDYLRRTPIQTGDKENRIRLENVQPFAGRWINASAEYTDRDDRTRRVAISLGPEYGTVTAQQIKQAAMEAVQGLGHDMLLVCGFAFDGHVSEEAKRYGSLTVLPVRMNADLMMGEELLKKTGSGNLFMIFGEPDVEISTQDDGCLTVTINGVDVYDPTTGALRPDSTDDIATWFIDTNYDGESFFVRHAYFTGAQEPYDRLKRALRAEIDEDAWASLYRTESRPFERPDTGRIAVKVINHFGDEVMKVFEV